MKIENSQHYDSTKNKFQKMKILINKDHHISEVDPFTMCLKDLAKAVKEPGLDPVVLDPAFLITIIKETKKNTLYAFHCLQALNEAGAINKDNIKEVETLITTINGKDEPEDEAARITYYFVNLSEAVKRQKLDPAVLDLTFLITILKKTKGKEAKYVLDCLQALTEAGVVNKDNLKQVETLIITIKEKVKELSWHVYLCLRDLAKAVKEQGLDPLVLDLTFLTTIVERAGKNTADAFEWLEALTEAGLVNKDNLEQVKTFIITIIEKVKDNIEFAFKRFNELVKAVKEQELDPLVLDLTFLTTIVEKAELASGKVFQELNGFAKTVKAKKLSLSNVSMDIISWGIGYLDLKGVEVKGYFLELTEFIEKTKGLTSQNLAAYIEQWIYNKKLQQSLGKSQRS